MNIEIANRLVELRKKNDLTQEELAARLGISRQAVSKWERAEASPDTDNLIMLSRVYGVSLDELLKTDGEVGPDPAEAAEAAGEAAGDTAGGESKKRATKVQINLKGIHVEDEDDIVHVGWDGIHIEDAEGVHVNIPNACRDCEGTDCDGCDKAGWRAKTGDDPRVIINGKEYSGDGCVVVDGKVVDSKKTRHGGFWSSFPFPVLVTAVYLLMGFVWDLWHPGWVIFVTVPLYYAIINSVNGGWRGFAKAFPLPLVLAAVYLVMGLVWNLWHPGWLIFFLIPIYYPIVSAIKRARRAKRRAAGEPVPDDDEDDDD